MRKALHKLLFQASYSLAGKAPVIKHYKEFMETQWWLYEELLEVQLEQLQRLIHFSYEYVPYYRHLFDSISLKPNDIKSRQDLQKLPILTKRIIKQHRDEITPKNLETLKYTHGSTGGSTGEPLQYLMSYEDYVRGIALLYRGWSYGGYRLGDRMAIIGGFSLISTTQTSLQKWAISYLRNIRSYPFYAMSDEMLMQYVRSLNNFKPEFLRGYASSIYILASFIRDKGLTINFHPRGVFTTAETLLEAQRRVIEDVFSTDVFDNYGLNDGGVSAYECEKHCGRHIDMERAILEVVDENGHQIFDKPGRIVATSLYNYAFPFIRYDTGDVGVQSQIKCPCKRESPILTIIEGRTNDILKLAGKKVRFPASLFAKLDVEQYQVIQETEESIKLKIVKGKTYGRYEEDVIKQWIKEQIGFVNISFEYVPSIVSEGGSKHKFIIDQRGDTCEAD